MSNGWRQRANEIASVGQTTITKVQRLFNSVKRGSETEVWVNSSSRSLFAVAARGTAAMQAASNALVSTSRNSGDLAARKITEGGTAALQAASNAVVSTARNTGDLAARKIAEGGTALQAASNAVVSTARNTGDRLVTRPLRAIGRMIRFLFIAVAIILLLILAIFLAIVIYLPGTQTEPVGAMNTPTQVGSLTASAGGPSKIIGCGSHGGPGVRLASGECASWDNLPSTPTASAGSPSKIIGCGSHGGPGVRLASGECASWSNLPSTPTAPVGSTSKITGCGSRGGPGVRLSSGKCASWSNFRRHERTYRVKYSWEHRRHHHRH